MVLDSSVRSEAPEKRLYLSTNHRRLINIIKEFRKENGYGPTYSEIMSRSRMKGRSFALRIDGLCEHGYVKEDGGQFFVTEKYAEVEANALLTGYL